MSLTVGTKLLRTNFTGFELEPSARLLWTPTDKPTVWAAFTHALRTPSDAEEDFFLSGYITTTAPGLPYFARFNANHNFAPEQLNGYELGYRRLLGKKVYFDVAGFYNHYHDLFDEEITGASFVETKPAPRPSSASGPVPQRPARHYQGRGNRARVEAHEFLAAARILFLPAHEHHESAALRRRGHRARYR